MLKRYLIGVSLFIFSSMNLWATTVHYVNCGISGTGLQDAIDNAVSGNLIRISGICREAIRINNKDLTLYGNTGAGLETPNGTWSFAPYTNRHPLLLITNARVTIHNLHFNGRQTGDDSNHSSLMGVYFLNANGEVSNSRFTGFRKEVRTGDWSIVPIRILNTSVGPDVLNIYTRTVTITNNHIEDFETNGIFANTNDGHHNHAPLVLYINNNHIVGAGTIETNQNGIQVHGFKSGLHSSVSGSIKNNDIHYITSSSTEYDSSAILTAPYQKGTYNYVRCSQLEYSGNEVTNSDIGLAIHNTAALTLSGNSMRDGMRGMELVGKSFLVSTNAFKNLEEGIYSSGTISTSKVTVSGNSFINVANLFLNAGTTFNVLSNNVFNTFLPENLVEVPMFSKVVGASGSGT